MNIFLRLVFVPPMALAACVPATDAPVPATPTATAPAPAPVDAGDAASVVRETDAVPVRRDFEIDGELTQGGWITGYAPSGTKALSLGEQAVTLAPDGRFFAAFDRDEATRTDLVAVLVDGRRLKRELSVSPREWEIERVNVARTPGTSSAAFRERRAGELERIWNARQRDTGATGWRQEFIWPVKGRISGRFGSQRIYRGEPGSYHSGIDIAPGEGIPFVAPADGVVVLAVEDFSLEGQLLIIDHGNGLNSAFLHASRLMVEEGDRVRQGQHIGNIGSSGRATGPHLHWSVKWHNARLDPILLTGPMS